MGEEESDEMRDWVRKNMAATPPNVLRDNRDRAAKFVGVADDGSVAVKSGEDWPDRQRIAAYYLGKQYVVAAGYADDPVVENQELSTRLGIPENSVAPRVKELRDARIITSVGNGRHMLPLSGVTRVLDELEKL